MGRVEGTPASTPRRRCERPSSRRRLRQPMPSRPSPSPASPPRSHARPTQNGNRILATVATKEFARLRPHLTTVTLEQRHPVWQPNEPFREIYFPLDAVVSVLAVAGGGVVEVATIGNEGVVGLPAFLGAET